MANENIVQLPSVLERLATRLKTYLNRDATNRHEWIEIQEGICCTLAEAREEIGADIPFGQWCKDNGFDKINHQDRAAAIVMGNDPMALHACLQVTERRSLQLIHKHEFERFTSASKPSRRKVRPKHKPSPEFTKAKAAIAELQAEGATVSHKAVRERAGVSDTPVRIAMAEARAEAELPPLSVGDMNKTQEKRFEIAVRKARAQIREELKDEVYKELDHYVVYWKEKVERADRILSNWNGIMAREKFRMIRACLHPDHNSFTHAAEAFQTFIALEGVLVKPEPSGLTAPPMPGTAAELMALRRKR